MRRNTMEIYKLPQRVEYCKRCVMSNQRPRITFENGICSACLFSDFKRTVDWRTREWELEKLCDEVRSKNGDFDVVVPVSGGKDGSFVAHVLKTKYGMNPLTVTWSPLRYTDIGRANLTAFIDSGFHHILGTPSIESTRKLTKLSFKYLGDPFQPFIYGQTNFPLRVAVDYGIQLIMYGENGEVEYGGDMKNAHRPDRDVSDHEKHYFSSFPPELWSEYGLTSSEIKPFSAPSMEEVSKNKTKIHFMSYYHYWDPQENFYYCKENTGFSPNPTRSEGTYSRYASLDDKFDGFHYFLGFIKFGIGRATSDAAHEIRDGKITREDGIALVKKYDGEFPETYFKEFLAYSDLTEDEFWEIIDSWRSDHIWRKEANIWTLRNPIWRE